MTESAYYIFKRPDLIAKGEPFLEVWLSRFQAQVHYTPNLAQEINLSRIPAATHCRKGSFDGGIANIRALAICASNHDEVKHGTFGRRFPSWYACNSGHGSGLTVMIPANTTFRAALTGRCFRYLDCFDLIPDRGQSGNDREAIVLSPTHSQRAGPDSGQNKAVYLSSQLGRKTDCFDGGSQVCNADIGALLPEHGHTDSGRCEATFKAVCGTQTKQGGCLYEQPCSQENCYEQANIKRARHKGKPLDVDVIPVWNVCWHRWHRCFINNNLIWQKPGIGIAAVSPVPKRDIRKGEGTDYPYQ